MDEIRLRIRSLRWMSWLVFCGALLAVGGCVRFLLQNPGHLRALLQTLLPIVFFWEALPLLATQLAVRNRQQVSDSGNRWRIGKYSEEDIRSLAQQATTGLPNKLRNPRIMIADRRGTGGWTRLSLFWPGWQRRKTIWITEGSLHYLTPDELKALVVHEIAHHACENRCDAPGGWLLGDVALFCLVFWIGSRFYLDGGGILVVFCVVRAIALGAAVRILGRTSQMIEHLCDLYAAARTGCGAMVNVLLKSGEEEELVETVLARAAGELRHVKGLELEDLVIAFEDVRPAGRIFHDNLLRHASQVVRKLLEETKPRQAGRDHGVNQELETLVKHRRQMGGSRIRWREFDGDGDSRLAAEEIARLREALRSQPERTLFRCESERNPTSHPTYRARILLLSDRLP